MANISVRFYSNCLRRFTTFNMYLPNDIREEQPNDSEYANRPVKTLFLLHGYTGDAENWVPWYLADKYNFAVVIPNGENSFWLDGQATGHAFCKFLGEELMDYVRRVFGLAKTKEDTYIMGMSMGGFGALHTALYYPEKFGQVTALSSALLVHDLASLKEGEDYEIANYAYFKECFGDPAKLLESRNNPETLIKEIKAEGKECPKIYMACGDEDSLLEKNREFHKFLESEGIEHTYVEDKGDHNMEFWDKYLRIFIPKMFE